VISAEQGESEHHDPADGPEAATFAMADAGPTVRRIVLGSALRRYREVAGLTLEQAADTIRATHSKVSRVENGRVAVKQRDVADLLTLYGVTDAAERERLLLLARQASAQGWWHQYTDVLPHWFEGYIGLEAAASEIRGYEVQFVHGLLQTEDYARAVIRIANAHAPEDEIERRVSLRLRRQYLLTRPDPPKLWAVLDEAALRRPPDGRTVMRTQLEHLLEVAGLPNVTVQIVPFLKGPHAAAGGPFSMLRFPHPDIPDVVYLEHLNSGYYEDKPEDVARYLTVMHQLVTQAATPDASKAMLRSLMKDI
jgi:transcriptional regulator with XRE-family HTH domain